jgi:hypothetical protein
VDSHNFPNLALMKLSAYHKARGDKVEWYFGELKYYDIVYMSKVFDTTYSPDMTEPYINVGKVIKGGTGYGLDNQLSDEIEHMMPDYGLYGITKTAYGFLTRGCPRACPFCIVAKKEGRKSVKAADLAEWWNGQKEIKLLDPNILACREHPDLLKQLAKSGAWVDFTQGLDARLLTEDNINALNSIKIKMIHFAWDSMSESETVIRGLTLYKNLGTIKDDRKLRVYVLTNYNTTMDENLYRIYYLRGLGYDPYVMIYDKPNAPKEIKRLQRWVNNKFIWRSCERFDDYIA